MPRNTHHSIGAADRPAAQPPKRCGLTVISVDWQKPHDKPAKPGVGVGTVGNSRRGYWGTKMA